MIFNAFSFSKAEYCIHVNHSSETFKVIYLKRFLFYARNNFKTGELKNVEKLVEETVQALWTENVHFFYNYVRNYIPGRWSLKSP